jgi:hypothetical protein
MLLGSALLAVISVIEIAMRNRLHAQIANDFGSKTWLTDNPLTVSLMPRDIKLIKDAIKQAQRDKYSKLTNGQKRQLDLRAYPQGVPTNIKQSTLLKGRQQTIRIAEGDIVANTTIYFWKRFFAPEYEPKLWKRSVKKVFPNKSLRRADVSVHVEQLYKTRNRLAHHEPIFGDKLRRASDSVDFMLWNFDSRRPSDDAPLKLFAERPYNHFKKRTHEFQALWDEVKR